MAQLPAQAPKVAAPPTLNVWQKLKLYVARRHDYFEGEYKANNFAADEASAAFYRAIFEVMRNLEEEDVKSNSKKG